MAIHVNEYNSTGAENNEIVMKYRKKKKYKQTNSNYSLGWPDKIASTSELPKMRHCSQRQKSS